MNVLRGYATTSFGQVHYRYSGTPGGRILVLLHQTPSDSAMFEKLMLELSGDYRLFAPDTPGMGMSDPVNGEMTIAALANGILEFLDEVGIDECLLFGHHTGAAIAMQLAADHPGRVEAVALSGPTLLDETLKSRLPEVSRAFDVDADGSHLTSMWERIRNKDASVALDIVQRETLSGIALGENYPAAYDAVLAHDAETALDAIECPALVFAGTNDVLYGQLDAACAHLKHGTKAELADARTFVCETHTADVAGILREFFAKEAA